MTKPTPSHMLYVDRERGATIPDPFPRAGTFAPAAVVAGFGFVLEVTPDFLAQAGADWLERALAGGRWRVGTLDDEANADIAAQVAAERAEQLIGNPAAHVRALVADGWSRADAEAFAFKQSRALNARQGFRQVSTAGTR